MDLVDQYFEEEGEKCGLGKECHEMGREIFRKLLLDLMHRNGNLYDWDIVQYDKLFDLFIDHKIVENPDADHKIHRSDVVKLFRRIIKL